MFTSPTHQMWEEQVSFTMKGPLDHPIPFFSARGGRANFAQHGRRARQQATSQAVSEAKIEIARKLGERALASLGRFAHAGAQISLQGLIRNRDVLGIDDYCQSFSGYWGSLKIPGAWESVFGGNSGGQILFRRGPWEDWPTDLPSIEPWQPQVPILFSPYCATLFHEAVGHAMEADYLADSPLVGKQGEKLSHETLTMMDRPDVEALPGSMSHDDTGLKATATTLIHRGFLVGDLDHEKGVWRRASFRDRPQVRASNFMVRPGPEDLASWLADATTYVVAWIQRGNWLPGTQKIKVLTGPTFQLERGRPVAYKPWTYLTFSTLELLNRVEAVGSDFCMDPVTHWCVKRGQSVPIGLGMPSVLLRGAS